jgi:hypothetical protein
MHTSLKILIAGVAISAAIAILGELRAARFQKKKAEQTKHADQEKYDPEEHNIED